MTRRLFINGRILTGSGVRSEGHLRTIDGVITEVGQGVPRTEDAEVVDLNGDWLAPGFVDVQVNGGGGVLFNEHPEPNTLAQMSEAHRKSGTTSLMPTLISDSLDVVEAGISAVRQAIQSGIPGIRGIHIEGPILNPRKCGIHDPERFIELDEATLDLLTSLECGRTLVTLAPERCTPGQIKRLVEAGVIVSIGHTDGRFADARRALEAGASGFTHLFNAMSPVASREPGIVGAALDNETAWTSLIVDGVHVDPIVLNMAMRLRPEEKLILITDAMANAGTDLDHFYLQGRRISVSDGQCRDENGILAGAALSMSQAVRNSVEQLGASPSQAIRMASEYPAAFLGLSHERGRLSAGLRADLIRLDAALEIVDVWSSDKDDVESGAAHPAQGQAQSA